MRAVIQRVTSASVIVDGGEPRPIGPGLVILLGVKDTDTLAIVPKLAEKCAHLRIFSDKAGKLNKSAVELGYSALVVSNFTLYADTKKGQAAQLHCCRKAPAFSADLRAVPGKNERTGPEGGSARRIRRRHAAEPDQRRPGDHCDRHRRMVIAAPGKKETP